MRAHVPSYELKVPASLREALSLLAEPSGEWKPIAGGTDLMVLFEAGKLSQKKFVSLWKMAELRGIEVTPGHVTLGALTTYSRIQAHPILQSEFPLLCRAAQATGAVAIQNRGTLGGNIANASPAADSPPALACYDTQIELISQQGSRWVPYQGFHLGYKKTVMSPNELIGRIKIERNTESAHQYYRKIGTRKAQAISKVCFAGLVRGTAEDLQDVRISIGSVGPTTLRCSKTEQFLKGKKISAQVLAGACAELAQEIAPMNDIRSTAAFRLKVAQNLLEEFLCGIGSQS